MILRCLTTRGEGPRTSGLGMEAALPASVPACFFWVHLCYNSLNLPEGTTLSQSGQPGTGQQAGGSREREPRLPMSWERDNGRKKRHPPPKPRFV